MIRLKSPARHAVAMTVVIGPLLAGSAVLALASCSGAAVAPGTAQPGFVSHSYNVSYYSPASRAPAPAVSGTTLSGARLGLASDRGNVVVLNFWGSWCSPCRREAPALAALAQHFKGQPVRFVGDNVRDYVASADAFERTFRIGYPSLNDSDGQIVLAFHSTVPPAAIPTTLVIDRGGHIAARVVGEATYGELQQLIVKVLAQSS